MTALIKPAATVILMREAQEGGFEIFMVKRSSRSPFGSLYVFPGGKLDPEDSEYALYQRCEGMEDAELLNSLGLMIMAWLFGLLALENALRRLECCLQIQKILLCRMQKSLVS